MKVKTYKKIKLVLIALATTGVAISIIINSAFVALVTLGLTLATLTLLKTRVKGVLVDERQDLVAGNAAKTSFKILMPILAFSSIALVIGGSGEDFHYIKSLGIIVSYITCLGLVIYVLAYAYFNRKSGGK